ncbi:hypothetical protein [Parageobacillus sp. G301]|uniref:hypothetical protein n=1 Tax=Parageobacillus sp. G301 TaxID=2998290 RepID=UPI002498FFC3|nr:hypothetical protein [Parageobacillus sp. G301]GLH64370.1 hypothetical protein PG301_22090 [Parageobacillus sp. G301]
MKKFKKSFIVIMMSFVMALGFADIGAEGASAKTWKVTGSLYTTWYVSGYFSNYVIVSKTFTQTQPGYSTIIAGVEANSKAKGYFTAYLQKKSGSKWITIKTVKVKRNGYTSLTYHSATKATYRYMFVNTGSKTRVNYTFSVKQAI